jgi:hypothetical protein
MPNVLDTDPIRAFVRRVAEKIEDPRIRARFEKLAFTYLLADSRNFRPASPQELDAAPEWARAAAAKGEVLSVFVLCQSARMRLHNVARRIAHTCQLAAMDLETHPERFAGAFLAREFLSKFDRASFDVVARKASYYASLYDNADCDGETKAACAAQSAPCANGRVWRRITSLAELRATGREFHNCLARSSRASTYGRKLRRGFSQFWVLRDQNGAGLMVAQAPTERPLWFNEVRGPHNAIISSDNADLQRLAYAIGILRDDPPPPSQAADTPSHTLPTECVERRRRAA